MNRDLKPKPVANATEPPTESGEEPVDTPKPVANATPDPLINLSADDVQSPGRSGSCQDPPRRRPRHQIRWKSSNRPHFERLGQLLPREEGGPGRGIKTSKTIPVFNANDRKHASALLEYGKRWYEFQQWCKENYGKQGGSKYSEFALERFGMKQALASHWAIIGNHHDELSTINTKFALERFGMKQNLASTWAKIGSHNDELIVINDKFASSPACAWGFPSDDYLSVRAASLHFDPILSVSGH